MIVRINQFDPANAEPYTGWEADAVRGPIEYEWPTDTNAFELLILETDEHGHKLAPAFRQGQLRQLMPDVIAALRDPAEEIVVRLDGPIAPHELLGALPHLTDVRGHGRFAMSAVQKFDAAGPQAMGSVRLYVPMPRLPGLCSDLELGLHRNVRMRAFSVREPLVNPLLDIDDLADERWREILPQVGFVLGTVRTLQAIHILTRRYTPQDTRTKLMNRLSQPPPSAPPAQGAASSEPPPQPPQPPPSTPPAPQPPASNAP
jgi:hypothetical protein